jgi:hypothetical protein
MNEILLKAEGNGFDGGVYDLRAVETVISSYRQIIDKTLPVVLNHKTLTPEIRSNVKYEARIKQGSLEVYTKLILQHKEDIAALLLSDGGKGITVFLAKLIVGVVEFRRKFTDLLEKGIKPSIGIINGNFVDNSIHNSGTINITINDPRTYIAADASRAPMDRLINGVDGDIIDSVELTHNKEHVKLTHEDNRITGKLKEELPTHIDIFGRLDAVSFSSHRGTIISGNGRHLITWDENIRSKVQKVVDVEGILFKARPIIDNRRIKDNTIAFHLLDCYNPQQSMAFNKGK